MSWLSRREDIKAIRDALGDELPCCPNCCHWREGSELCGFQNVNQRPPARVIAYGCDQFEDDVPF